MSLVRENVVINNSCGHSQGRATPSKDWFSATDWNLGSHEEEIRDTGGVLIVMHGRSRRTIDPRIPTMPITEHVELFTDQADIASTKREAPCDVRRVA